MTNNPDPTAPSRRALDLLMRAIQKQEAGPRRSPYTLNVRLTADEIAEIRKRAAAAHMNVSEYVRAVALAPIMR